MKFWKRILRSLLRALLFGGIGFLLFTARGYYLDYQEFREHTNYKFASVADFFYQLNAEYWLDFQFVDQNVSEVTLGDRQVRTMEVDVELLGHSTFRLWKKSHFSEHIIDSSILTMTWNMPILRPIWS